MTKDNSTRSELLQAMLALQTEEEAAAFFDDLCTLKEIQSLAQRLQVARLLREGRTFTDIVERTGASSATIARVNRCLQAGPGGYKTVLDRLDGKE
jgi:TrpR-related protein YerC/YecD